MLYLIKCVVCGQQWMSYDHSERELRIRLYSGVGIQNGKIVRSKLPDLLPPEEYARMHMKHLMLEYGNEARLVNQFWERKHKK